MCSSACTRRRPRLNSGSCTGTLAPVAGSRAGDSTEALGRRFTMLCGFRLMQHLYMRSQAAREHQRSIHEACLPIPCAFICIFRGVEVAAQSSEKKCEKAVLRPSDTNLRPPPVMGLCRASRGSQTAPYAGGRTEARAPGRSRQIPGVGKGLNKARIVYRSYGFTAAPVP